jgi:hypothetical protein
MAIVFAIIFNVFKPMVLLKVKTVKRIFYVGWYFGFISVGNEKSFTQKYHSIIDFLAVLLVIAQEST